MPPQNSIIISENETQKSSSGSSSSNSSKLAISVAEDEILVDNKIYNALKLAANHPGGDLFVKSFAGRDATNAFISYHRKPFPHQTQSYALEREAKDSKIVLSSIKEKDFFELCELVDKVLPKNKSFATTGYWLKLFLLLSTTFALEIYMHFTSKYPWYLMGVLGFLMALIGLNVQHDANHGALSRNSRINSFFGFAQNYIGGSRVDWIHQHVVQHHVATNDVDNDPDMAGSSVMRLNPTKPILSIHSLQYLYVFVLLSFFGFSVTTTSMLNVLRRKNYTSMSKLLKSFFAFETFTSIIFFCRMIVLPLLAKPAISTLIDIAPVFVVAGYYLSFFFLISHNFEGAHVINRKDTKESRDKNSNVKDTFLYNQVASSSNVGGSFLCFLNGGLNYQIEHHLFPRIQHTHYPTIAPIVKKFCERKNIPYRHFSSISENVQSCVKHLYHMGRQNEKGKNKTH